MNTKLTSGLLGIAALLMACLVNATTVQISPASLPLIVGDPVQLIVQGVDFAPTNGGGFSLSWDPAALALSSSEAEIGGELFNNGLGGNSVPITQGQLEIIHAVSPTVPLSGNFNITTLFFTALSVVDVTGINFIANQPAWLDENNAVLDSTLQPNYVGASIIITTPEGVVPVPATIWLFDSGLIGLIGLARRKS